MAHADMAILRHLYDPLALTVSDPFNKVVNESEFNRIMDSSKSNLKEWASLDCIQSCIKAKHGLGKHIPIDYRAELDT